MGTAANIVTLVSLPLGVLALFLAWRQLSKSTSAARAAAKAAESTALGIANYHVVTLIAQAHYTENALDGAVNGTDPIRTVELLNAWKQTGTEIHGMLESSPKPPAEVLAVLTRSFAAVTQAKSRLMDAGVDQIEATVAVRRAIGEATVALGSLSGQLKIHPGGSNNP